MISTNALTSVRTIAFAIAGLISGGYAIATLMGVNGLPHWLPLTAGGIAALVFAVTALLAGHRNTAASLDESYQHDRRTAGNIGFWTAILTGTTLWLAQIGDERQLAITLTLASAVYLLAHVVLEVRGR